MDVRVEDRADAIDGGPVQSISFVEDHDPRRSSERPAMSAASRFAQALHSADELLWGLRHHDWRVRHESVARLVGRVRHDSRTLPALYRAVGHDTSWQVRDVAVWGLLEFEPSEVLPVLQAAAHDIHPQVRWSARFALFQKGRGAYPGPSDQREGSDRV